MRVSFLFAVLALLALFATVSAVQMHDEASELSRAMESWSSDETYAFAEVDSELDAEMEAEMEDELAAEAEAEEMDDAHFMEANAEVAQEVSDELLKSLVEMESVDVDVSVLAEIAAGAELSVASQLKGGNCGSGWTTKIVPDYNMSSACLTHDRCYAICGRTQKQCDSQFLSNMQAICKKKYPNKGLALKLRACNTQAKVYYTAVSKLGKNPHKKGQDKACKKKRL